MQFFNLCGARIYPDTDLDWKEWSLLEFLGALDVTPQLDELRSPGEYVPGLSGWVNRVNDIRDRIRCRKCSRIMTAHYGYARNLARYNKTVFSCQGDDSGSFDHDTDIYFNHCWACHNFIDSRESEFKDKTYYICKHCGSGEQESKTFTQGDICPKCGAKEMKLGDLYTRDMVCVRCDHTIVIPGERCITGTDARRERLLRHLRARKNFKNGYSR